jgi:hypothetical protein
MQLPTLDKKLSMLMDMHLYLFGETWLYRQIRPYRHHYGYDTVGADIRLLVKRMHRETKNITRTFERNTTMTEKEIKV